MAVILLLLQPRWPLYPDEESGCSLSSGLTNRGKRSWQTKNKMSNFKKFHDIYFISLRAKTNKTKNDRYPVKLQLCMETIQR